MAASETVTKVKQKYEAAWGSYLQVAEQVAREEGQNLARILGRCLYARNMHAHKAWRRYLPQMGGMDLSPRVPGASQIAYYSSVVIELLRQYVPADAARIVEMGSGWGAIISSFWLAGGPRDAAYYALEYTDNGRATTRVLAAAEPRFQLRSLPFDYYDADFSGLAAQDAVPPKTVLYSIFSIEQIAELPESLIERMLAVPGFARAVHIEPVGWQFRRNGLGARFDAFLARIGLPPLTRKAATSRRCRKAGFNRNLVELLRRYEAAGRIVIEAIDIDIVSPHPGNAGTLIVWRKA
ncbi:MAG TPA: hypothetical protein VM639_12915 [Dongiaceae bacterium]|nr:hypothetical protein [Dongiaceae bacterium]